MSQDDWNAAFEWADAPGCDAPAGHPGEGPFKVWRCNWETALCFLACSTQWRVAGMGGVLGLDYGGVEVVMRQRKVGDTSVMFGKLQAMESAALGVLRHD